MPSCRVTNYTSQPLNVSLKHLCALHFENNVAPGATVKLKPGPVWFTLEVLVDAEHNRYSVAQSAAAIAIVSLACVGTAALAIPAAAAAGGVVVGGAVGNTVGSTIIAGGSTIITGFSAACATAGGFLAAHAGTAAKLSAAFLPKAIDIVEKEVGGFNAVQKEVVQILSSPSVTEDVRTQGLSILSRLAAAVAADRAAEEQAGKPSTSDSSQALPTPPQTKEDSTSKDTSGSSLGSRPSLKRMQTSVSTLMHKISTEGRDERKSAKREAKEAKETASWEVVDKDSGMLSSKEQLRIHGLFMNERRHFEVREKNGKLVLIDANTREVVVG